MEETNLREKEDERMVSGELLHYGKDISMFLPEGMDI